MNMDAIFDIKVLLGALLVTLVALYRFNTFPPPRPTLSSGLPRPLAVMKVMLDMRDEPASPLFPPPRANTTFFKFTLYRIAYAVTGVIVYLVLFAIPGVAGELDEFLRTYGTTGLPALQNGGPLLIALAVAVLFPLVPPFRAAERAIRRTLYERACIPAQQLRERNRLKDAGYRVDPALLAKVRANLSNEDFEPADLVLEEFPTTRSLWTKVAILMTHIQCWQAEDRYKMAFATLHERDGVARSVDHLIQMFEALKAEARIYSRAARQHRNEPETEAQAKVFRRQCVDTLESIYDLLSRVSLHSHYTDRDRVTCMRQLGFSLSVSETGPIPDADDLAALAVLLACIVFFPLSHNVGAFRAIVIGVEVAVAIMTPILIAAHHPAFAGRGWRGMPGIAFPLVSGLAAAAISVPLYLMAHTFARHAACWLDLGCSARLFASRGQAWTVLIGLIAVLIAWRMRTDVYPDPATLHGMARIREWGHVRDAGVFMVCALALVVFFVVPKVTGHAVRPGDWSLVLKPTIIATVIGFFVPTWYRAQALRQPSKAAVPSLTIGATASLP